LQHSRESIIKAEVEKKAMEDRLERVEYRPGLQKRKRKSCKLYRR